MPSATQSEGERDGAGAARGALLTGPGGARCSAVLLGGGRWALTTGAALGPALLRRLAPHELPAGRLLLPAAALRPLPRFSLLADDDDDAHEGAAQKRAAQPAALAGLWRCALLSEALRLLLAQWALSDEEAAAPDHPRAALPVLVVLRVGAAPDAAGAARDAPDHLLRGASEALAALLSRVEARAGAGADGGWRGRRLLLEGSPFGSAFFLNAWSGGVASGAAGPRGCLLLADALAAPGCEGAPAFLLEGGGDKDDASDATPVPDREGGPVALVVAPVSWWRGEWVGFTLLAALQPVLRALLHPSSAPSPSPSPASAAPRAAPAAAAAVAAADAGVVLVRCGGEWGSGVAVALPPPSAAPSAAAPRAPSPPPPRLVLTCAHVVRNAAAAGEDAALGLAVHVWWRGARLGAQLLYRTPPGRAFDVAVLQLEPPPPGAAAPRGLPIAQAPAKRGERVLGAGFALFSERDASPLLPLLAAGEVARARPALLQSTCVAQSGASGGALLRPSGHLLALIVCNVRDAMSGALYPHFNMAVPLAALRPALQRFAETRDELVLKGLESNDPCVQRLWELEVPAANCKL